MEQFKAVHKQDGQTIIGNWDTVSNLDKRVWNIIQLTDDRGNDLIDDMPLLARIEVLDTSKQFYLSKQVTVTHYVYQSVDLVHIHLS